jgi:predicted nucleic acid-binding protein
MKYLADANVLVALVVSQHEHHIRAQKFFSRQGHRQWNDFYLVALAEKNELILATFDGAIAANFPISARLIP